MPLHYCCIKKNKLSKFKILFVTLFLLINYCSSAQSDNEIFNCIKFVHNFPFVKDEKTVLNLRDSNLFIFYKNYTIIEFKYKHEESIKRKTTIKYIKNYFIHHIDSTYGILCNNLNNFKSQRLKIKEFYSTYLFEYPSMYFKDGMKLVSQITNKNYSLIEKFIPAKISDFSDPDTLYYFYKKEFPKIRFSIAKELDSIKNIKLTKFIMVYNNRFIKEKGIIFPKRKFIQEIKIVEHKKKKDLIEFAEKYSRL